MHVVDYRGPGDLGRMQTLAQRLWTPESRWHVGDVAWDRRAHHEPSEQWPTALWLEGDGGVERAWAWLELPDHLETVVDHATPGLHDAVICWALARTSGSRLTTTIMRSDAAMRSALERRGFARAARHDMYYLIRDLDGGVAPRCPDGYRVRGVEPTEADLVARAEVHRQAWAPSSTMTRERYETVQRTWPYRHELDVVVEVREPAQLTAPVFAASCLAWYDELHKVGELEPVGTHPAHRRRGLGALACAEALRRLESAGATRAIIYATTDPGNIGPVSLYRSLGFEVHAGTETFAFDVASR